MASILNVDQINNAAGTSAVTIDATTGKPSFPNGATLPAGSVVQVVTHEQSALTTRYAITTSTTTEIDSAERVSITPKAAGNKLVFTLNFQFLILSGTYGAIYPCYSTDNGSTFLTAIAMQGAGTSYAKGSTPSGSYFGEMWRNTSSNLWHPGTVNGFITTTSTNPYLFTVYGHAAGGSGLYLGDGGQAITWQIFEVAQ